jgi:chorismate-pyruvate lyase
VLAPARPLARAGVPDALLPLHVPEALRDWLLHDRSITGRVAARFGPVHVQLLREGRGRATALEARLLARGRRQGPRRGGGWWVREIALATDGHERLRARTLVPPDAPGLRRALSGLGARPLGRLLFVRNGLRPGVRRRYRCAVPTAAGGWMRATVWRIAGEELLVLETPTAVEEPPWLPRGPER